MSDTSTTETFGAPNDPWNLLSTGYSLERFYTRSTDGNGHSDLIHIKISPLLHGQIIAMVEDRRIPAYRTQADVVRDALLHRLKYISDEYEGLIDLADLEQEQRQAELDRTKRQRDAWKKYLNDLDAQLTEMIADNELDEAEWLMDRNEWSDTMTVPYLRKLADILSKHRKVIERRSTL